MALAAGLLVVLGTMLLERIGGLVAGLAFAVNAGVIEASREARPYALGLLGVVLATLLFVFALERGGGWRWIPYAVVAAGLPLTHPLAASVLAAHGAALIALRERPDLRRAGIALVAGTVVAGALLTWMAADRFDAPDGAGALDLGRLGRGLVHPIGVNPVLVIAAAAGLYALFALPGARSGRWRGVLVAALIAAPLVALLFAALALPVFTGALVLCAPGVALAAGAAAPLLAPVRGLVWAGVALLLVSSAVATADRLRQPPDQDWRALAAAVKRVRGGNETVVVVPARARAVVAYYAPYLPVMGHVRGSGGWVAVVADTPDGAIAAARPVVTHTALRAPAPVRLRRRIAAAALGAAVARRPADRRTVVGFSRPGSAQPARRAQILDHAHLAARLAGVAHAPAVPDQEMREAVPVGLRHDLHEVALDLDRILLARQREPLREPPHVRVDDDALRIAELGSDDVRRLARDARAAAAAPGSCAAPGRRTPRSASASRRGSTSSSAGRSPSGRCPARAPRPAPRGSPRACGT